MEVTPGIRNNAESHRFEMEFEGEFAYVEYRLHDGAMYLMHTFVPEKLRGRKIADQLALFALDYIEKEKIRVKIYCPFIGLFVKRNARYRHLAEEVGTSPGN